MMAAEAGCWSGTWWSHPRAAPRGGWQLAAVADPDLYRHGMEYRHGP